MTEQAQLKVTIELDLNALNVVAAGLGKLPMEVSLDVFNDIQRQAKEQLPEGFTQQKV